MRAAEVHQTAAVADGSFFEIQWHMVSILSGEVCESPCGRIAAPATVLPASSSSHTDHSSWSIVLIMSHPDSEITPQQTNIYCALPARSRRAGCLTVCYPTEFLQLSHEVVGNLCWHLGTLQNTFSSLDAHVRYSCNMHRRQPTCLSLFLVMLCQLG